MATLSQDSMADPKSSMADRIRLKVWLLGLGPIVLVIGAIAWLVAWRDGTPAPHAPTAAVESLQAQLPLPPALPVALSATSSPPAVTGAAPAPAPLASATGSVEPEPIPELDEIRTPPGSQGWSRQQKLDYMQKVLDDLATREHLLERQVADAQRARDPVTEQRKAATLAYLRTQKAGFERMRDVALGVRGEHD
jgi:hypothetical protein